jgi:hypothetical protein
MMAIDEKDVKLEAPAKTKATGKVVAKKKAVKPVVKKKAVKPAVKKTAAKPAVKKTVAKPVVKKAAAKPAVKKTAAKPAVKKTVAKPAVKKTVAKPVVKKAAAKPAVKKKPVVKKKVKGVVSGSPAATKMKALKVNLAELNQELSDLKAEIKSTKKRESAIALLASQRESALNKFLVGWDKKASAALEKSLSIKKKKAKKKTAKK